MWTEKSPDTARLAALALVNISCKYANLCKFMPAVVKQFHDTRFLNSAHLIQYASFKNYTIRTLCTRSLIAQFAPSCAWQ